MLVELNEALVTVTVLVEVKPGIMSLVAGSAEEVAAGVEEIELSLVTVNVTVNTELRDESVLDDLEDVVRGIEELDSSLVEETSVKVGLETTPVRLDTTELGEGTGVELDELKVVEMALKMVLELWLNSAEEVVERGVELELSVVEVEEESEDEPEVEDDELTVVTTAVVVPGVVLNELRLVELAELESVDTSCLLTRRSRNPLSPVIPIAAGPIGEEEFASPATACMSSIGDDAASLTKAVRRMDERMIAISVAVLLLERWVENVGSY